MLRRMLVTSFNPRLQSFWNSILEMYPLSPKILSLRQSFHLCAVVSVAGRCAHGHELSLAVDHHVQLEAEMAAVGWQVAEMAATDAFDAVFPEALALAGDQVMAKSSRQSNRTVLDISFHGRDLFFWFSPSHHVLWGNGIPTNKNILLLFQNRGYPIPRKSPVAPKRR